MRACKRDCSIAAHAAPHLRQGFQLGGGRAVAAAAAATGRVAAVRVGRAAAARKARRQLALLRRAHARIGQRVLDLPGVLGVQRL